MDILVCEELRAPAFERLAQRYQVVQEGHLWQQPARLRTLIEQVKVLVVRNQTQVTAELLRAAPHLLGIGRVGVGLDNIDVPEASRRGVVVVAPLSANATSVAELAMGLILALARKIPEADRSTKAGHWDRRGCTGLELAGKTLAICGLGRIGGTLARLAQAFAMEVVAYDAFVKPDAAVVRETGARLAGSLPEALAAADFVSVHLPLTPETRRVFNSTIFAGMKPGAFFVNTSRGAVVDEPALVEALQAGRLAGAALDVRDAEPPAKRGALESMANVIVTPHIGAFTAEAQARTFEAVAADVEHLLTGEPTVHFVNFERPRHRPLS